MDSNNRQFIETTAAFNEAKTELLLSQEMIEMQADKMIELEAVNTTLMEGNNTLREGNSKLREDRKASQERHLAGRNNIKAKCEKKIQGMKAQISKLESNYKDSKMRNGELRAKNEK